MEAATTKISNIFADIGMSKIDQAKYDLAFTVSKMIRESGLSQRDVAEQSGWTQAKVSALINGRLEGISIGKIIEVAQALGYVAEITFKSPGFPDHKKVADLKSETAEESVFALA